jgi:GNAT superfamily N-acetyltransferase
MARLIRVLILGLRKAIDPTMTQFTHRLAQMSDLDNLRDVMRLAIENLQSDFLSPDQVRASHHVMGLDTQLIKDQTYFIIEAGATIAGCGGWSWRATLYGGDKSMIAREPVALDPSKDPARIRAMYTNPNYARRGVGRMIMDLCEAAAANHGFSKVVLMATLSGEPLYRTCGYRPIEHIQSNEIDGVRVPLILMGKDLGA